MIEALREVGRIATAAQYLGTYAAWEEGHLSDMEALRALCMDLGETESDLEPLQGHREALRDQISHIVARLGDKVEIAGFGQLRIMQASVTEGFDKAKIKALIDDLIVDYPEIAARLVACSTKSMRAGGLRIEREKAAR